jgi:hypothetical protein
VFSRVFRLPPSFALSFLEFVIFDRPFWRLANSVTGDGESIAKGEIKQAHHVTVDTSSSHFNLMDD